MKSQPEPALLEGATEQSNSSSQAPEEKVTEGKLGSTSNTGKELTQEGSDKGLPIHVPGQRVRTLPVDVQH